MGFIGRISDWNTAGGVETMFSNIKKIVNGKLEPTNFYKHFWYEWSMGGTNRHWIQNYIEDYKEYMREIKRCLDEAKKGLEKLEAKGYNPAKFQKLLREFDESAKFYKRWNNHPIQFIELKQKRAGKKGMSDARAALDQRAYTAEMSKFRGV